MSKTVLYAKDASGTIREWNIEELEDGILITHGVMGGSMQEKFEEISEGLATRTLEEQIRSRANSRINKKIDSGYTKDLNKAKNTKRTNALGFEKPMLAQRFDKVKKLDLENAFIQSKFDGNRMLIKNENGNNLAYTRNGKIMESMPELLEGIKIPEGVTIDGEIYCHGESLQTIVSWVKRRQENTLKLRFQAYDIMNGMPYEDRLEELTSYDLGGYAEVVPTWKYTEGMEIKEQLKNQISLGYEGLIIRPDGFGYENKRSNGLIKVKSFFDEEFLIDKILLSKDGIPVLHCLTEEGIDFKVTAPGSFAEKNFIYENKTTIVGLYAHVEYSQITKDGRPFHPVCIRIVDFKEQFK